MGKRLLVRMTNTCVYAQDRGRRLRASGQSVVYVKARHQPTSHHPRTKVNTQSHDARQEAERPQAKFPAPAHADDPKTPTRDSRPNILKTPAESPDKAAQTP
jgi:hypothetical protein